MIIDYSLDQYRSQDFLAPVRIFAGVAVVLVPRVVHYFLDGRVRDVLLDVAAERLAQVADEPCELFESIQRFVALQEDLVDGFDDEFEDAFYILIPRQNLLHQF